MNTCGNENGLRLWFAGKYYSVEASGVIFNHKTAPELYNTKWSKNVIKGNIFKYVKTSQNNLTKTYLFYEGPPSHRGSSEYKNAIFMSCSRRQNTACDTISNKSKVFDVHITNQKPRQRVPFKRFEWFGELIVCRPLNILIKCQIIWIVKGKTINIQLPKHKIFATN